jgi:thioredoxin 2
MTTMTAAIVQCEHCGRRNRVPAGRIKLVRVDVDKAPRLSQRFAVQAVPTLMVVHRGEVISRQTGAASAAVLRRWIEDTLATVR